MAITQIPRTWSMHTYPISDLKTRVTFAFEIENVYLSPRHAVGILEKIEGVTNIRRYRFFGPEPGVHLKFQYRGQDCIVLEPYGDNSRYWIGPKKPKDEKLDLTALEDAFKKYRPPLLLKILGDFLSLRILRFR